MSATLKTLPCFCVPSQPPCPLTQPQCGPSLVFSARRPSDLITPPSDPSPRSDGRGPENSFQDVTLFTALSWKGCSLSVPYMLHPRSARTCTGGQHPSAHPADLSVCPPRTCVACSGPLVCLSPRPLCPAPLVSLCGWDPHTSVTRVSSLYLALSKPLVFPAPPPGSWSESLAWSSQARAAFSPVL